MTAPLRLPELSPEAAATEPLGDPFVLRLPDGFLTDELIHQLVIENEPWYLERNQDGDLEISATFGFRHGARSHAIALQIKHWAEQTQNGEGLGLIGYSLSTGSMRGCDCSWLSPERLALIDPANHGYQQVCPNLVVEVRARNQSLAQQQARLEEWLTAGAQLGWLIDPYTAGGTAHLYRPSRNPEILTRPDSLSGEAVAPGLTVDLSAVWRPTAPATD